MFFCRDKGNFCIFYPVCSGKLKSQATVRQMEQKRGVSKGADLQLGK